MKALTVLLATATIMGLCVVSVFLFVKLGEWQERRRLRREQEAEEEAVLEHARGRAAAERRMFDPDFNEEHTWEEVLSYASEVHNWEMEHTTANYDFGYREYLDEVSTDVARGKRDGEQYMTLGHTDGLRTVRHRIESPAKPDVQTFAPELPVYRERGPRIPRSVRNRNE